jgi:hypothetical protein
MGIETLQEIEEDYNYTLEDQAEIESKVQEEIELMLEDSSIEEIRDELDVLDDPEFREVVENVLDKN